MHPFDGIMWQGTVYKLCVASVNLDLFFCLTLPSTASIILRLVVYFIQVLFSLLKPYRDTRGFNHLIEPLQITEQKGNNIIIQHYKN